MTAIIKKNLIIFRDPEDWTEISAKIVAEYGAGIMISWRCRRELGFTVRYHKGLVRWADDEKYRDQEDWLDPGLKNRYHYEDQVHLDWYSESLMSFFILKYLS